MATSSRSRRTRRPSPGLRRGGARSGRSPAAAFVSGAAGERRSRCARLSQDASPRDLARIGAPVDPDLVFRSLAYAIEPEWTRGHRFTVAYDLVGEGGGGWHVRVDDGRVDVDRGLGTDPDAIVRIRFSDWLRLLSGEITPPEAMRLGLTEVEGPSARHQDRALDRPGPGDRRPRARARGAPADPPGAERGQLGERGVLQRGLGDAGDPARVPGRGAA